MHSETVVKVSGKLTTSFTEISNQLQREMDSKSVTIKDIAREAGVSPSLVSFVMSNNQAGKTIYRVNDKTSKQILEVARRLDYKPNNSARALRSGKTGTIGALVSDIANPFFAEIARYLEDHAFKYGYNVIFGSSDEDPEKLERVARVLLSKGVDGLIIVPCDGADKAIEDISKTGVPIVLLDRRVQGLNVSSVVLDNRSAARTLTEALIHNGARNINMVSYTMNVSNVRERENGYLDAVNAAGLNANIDRVSHNDYGNIPKYVSEARQRGVDSFMMATNTLSTLVLAEIYKNGLRIPEDIKVACFDRNPFYDIYGKGIIYARQPVEAFAGKAIEIIMSYIRNKTEPISPVEFVLPPEISL